MKNTKQRGWGGGGGGELRKPGQSEPAWGRGEVPAEPDPRPPRARLLQAGGEAIAKAQNRAWFIP